MIHAGTEVLMHDGTYKLAKDLVIGDLLMGPDSLPKEITKINIKMDIVYRLTGTFGSSVICTKNTIGRHMINVPIDFQHKDVNIDLSNVKYFLESNDYTEKPRISSELLINSKEVRQSVLQNLLTSMSAYKNFYEVEIFHNYDLVRDIQFLCLSLGIMVMLKKRERAQVHSFTLKIFITPKTYLGKDNNQDKIEEELIDNRTQKYKRQKIKPLCECYEIIVPNNSYVLYNFMVVGT